jgi:hypothetical protein
MLSRPNLHLNINLNINLYVNININLNVFKTNTTYLLYTRLKTNTKYNSINYKCLVIPHAKQNT